MIEVPAIHTAPGTLSGDTFVVDRAAWRQTRYQALVDGLVDRGMDVPKAMEVGLQLMPLLARETGTGRKEYGFAIGNIRPSSNGLVSAWQAGWHGAYDVRTYGRYRSYETLRDGVADMLRLLFDTSYRTATQHLLDTGDVAGFYERLIRNGYYPADEAEIQTARREYAALYQQMQGYGLTYTKPSGALRFVGLGVAALGVWLVYREVSRHQQPRRRAA